MRFKEAANNESYQVCIERDDEQDAWDVIASSTMVPSTEQITRVEQELDALARSFGGHSDGWGFLES